jgi:hypothetical protein
VIDEFIPQIECLQSEGAVVLLKWDGERSHMKSTIVVTRRDTDYIWRKDCDDVSAALAEALSDYRARHAS